MPDLDVTFLTFDPMLADVFNIERNAETIGDYGRMEVTTTLIEEVSGVVHRRGDEMMLTDDKQLLPRHITITTATVIYPALEGYQPDVILWRGGRYRVMKVVEHPQFGAGHYKVNASSPVSQEAPVTP
jgi:hypothetical protein